MKYIYSFLMFFAISIQAAELNLNNFIDKRADLYLEESDLVLSDLPICSYNRDDIYDWYGSRYLLSGLRNDSYMLSRNGERVCNLAGKLVKRKSNYTIVDISVREFEEPKECIYIDKMGSRYKVKSDSIITRIVCMPSL